jgi:hypothetical protein
MAGLLVFSALPLLAWVIYGRMARPDAREACVRATVGWAAGILLVSEGLSAVHALRFWPVFSFWIVVNGCLAVWLWRRGARAVWWDAAWWREPFALVAILLAVLASVIALAAPPNTPDVLAYHLPRQLFWLQQGGLQHFVTLDERALMMPPFAELMQAHALLLSGSDHWANVPQWIAYVVGLIVVSLLVRELGGGRRAQAMSALVFATVPMAWHEATSAKNDLLVAVWLGVAVWQAVRIATAGGTNRAGWLEFGGSLGVALATKTTALIFVPPVVAIAGRVGWRERSRSWAVIAIVLVLIVPHAARNLEWYGTPLGQQPAGQGGGQANENVSPGVLASNLLRSATLHLAGPSTGWNDRLQRAVESTHRWMGQDPNDRRTTLWFLQYGVEWGPEHEAIAGAPAQFILGVLVVAAGFIWTRGCGTAGRLLWFVAVSVILGALVLKWQPTGARLQLPVFLVLTALIGWGAERLGCGVMITVGAICLIGWLPSSETQLRPWRTSPTIFAASRWENYFRFRPRLQFEIEQSLAVLSRVRPDSLQIVTRHAFSYPLLLRLTDVTPGTRLWGTLPEATQKPPAAILVIEPELKLPAEYRPPGTSMVYRALPGLTGHALYLPASTP